jgi:hypothetical protein
MVTEILLAAIANTTATAQNGLDIRDLTGISNIIFCIHIVYCSHKCGYCCIMSRYVRDYLL